MTEDQRIKNEIEQRVKSTGNNIPPMPDFVRPVFKTNLNQPTQTEQIKLKAPQQNGNNFFNAFNGLDFLKKLNFKSIKFDNDVILIIILILVLSAEEGDKLLLFALIYIML